MTGISQDEGSIARDGACPCGSPRGVQGVLRDG